MSDPIGAYFHLSPGEEVQVTGVVTYERHYAMPELAMVTAQVDNLGCTRLPQSQVTIRADTPVDEVPQLIESRTKEDETMPKSYEQLREDTQQEVVEMIEDVLEFFGFADPGHYAPDVIDEIDEIVRSLSAGEGE